jgi:hypothetical protein
VEVLVILALGGYYRRSRDRWLGHHVVEHGPVELFLRKVLLTVLLDTIADADVDAIRRKHPVDFSQHLVSART